MKGEIKDLYIKRTQRDYPLSFKLAVVREIEQGGGVIHPGRSTQVWHPKSQHGIELVSKIW